MFQFSRWEIECKTFGGTAPYDVDWSNGAMGTTINSLEAGSYEVTIQDANGCFFTQPFQLNQPTPIVLTIDSLVPPICKGQDNGSIAVSVEGGTGNYTYLWNNGMTDEDINNLTEGYYYVSINDQNNCILTTEPYPLIGPELISIDAAITDPPCSGLNNGTIEVTITNSGGNSFAFDWSNDEHGNSLSGLGPGEYIVTITNEQTGCQLDSSFQITAQQILSLNVDIISLPAMAMQTDKFI